MSLPRPPANTSPSAALTFSGVKPLFFHWSIRAAISLGVQRLASMFSASMSCLSKRCWSSSSRMVKLDFSPTSSA